MVPPSWLMRAPSNIEQIEVEVSTEGSSVPEQAAPPRIAVIGMACRFPGYDDPQAFWNGLMERRDSVREIPPERWRWEDVFGDPAREVNKTNSKWGGFIDGIDRFDPLFFGMSPAEANFADPQHRLFLETAWRAIEDTGYRAKDFSGQTVGVYAGVSKNDYAELLTGDLPSFVSTGTVHSILANRVSFLLNLRGPSVPVDTACSSALVALHYAVRDLCGGECEAALVGGVNALLSPRMYITHAKSGMLSADGRCKTFDHRANGYVRGEGAGVVVLKRLDDALRDGDRIHGVICATAINHGGRGNFLTAPNVPAQRDVVLHALRQADVDPASLRYVEAHGTGTPLGDPIEIEALKQAFTVRSAELGQQAPVQSCVLGSVKANIGHLESAAGMAGLIKALLVVANRQAPDLVHFERLNPLITLEGSPFCIAPGSAVPAADGTPWRACVSSFGMGGVNAHVIVEAPPPSYGAQPSPGRALPFLFSAKKGRLSALLDSHAAWLSSPSGARANLADVAFTLAYGRDVYEERCAVVASTREELLAGLVRLRAGQDAPMVFGPSVVPANEALALHPGDVTAQEVAEGWMKGGIAGGDRRRLGAQAVSLPGYPFLRRSCWFKPFEAQASTGAPAVGAEAVELDDHRVQGLRHLPAVAYLRRVFAGVADAGSVTLSDVYWPQPLTAEVGATGPALSLHIDRNSGTFRLNGSGEHCRGVLSARHTPDPRLMASIDAKPEGSGQSMARDAIYAQLRSHGLDYGPSFQVLRLVLLFDDYAEADVTAGPAAHATGLWDAAFQAAALLSIHNGSGSDRQYLPFHLEHLHILAEPSGAVRIRVRQRSGGSRGEVLRFDIACTDANGLCIAFYENFAKRAYTRAAAIVQEPSALPLHLYATNWRAAPVKDATKQEPVLANSPDKVADALATPGWEARPWLVFAGTPGETDARDLLQLVQRLLAARPKQPVTLKYFASPEAGAERAAAQAVAGLARVVKIENPRIQLEVVVSAEPMSEEAVLREAATPVSAHHSISYRGGVRHELVVEDTAPPPAAADLPIRRGGVWIIAGGAGGLGRILSRWLAREHGARLVLTGRRAEDDAIRATLAELVSLGGEACYRQTDCGKPAEVDALVDWTRGRFGAIHCVAHAIGLIEDSFLLNKTPDSFTRVLSAKMRPAVLLDAATAKDALDLFICFSSVASLMPNSGQGDYAMGNAFLDHLMQERASLAALGQRHGASLSLCLPLLAEGGITVGPREAAQLWDEFGMRPLPSETLIALCGIGLRHAAAGGSQLLGITGAREKIARHLDQRPQPAPSAQLDIPALLARDLSVILAEQFHLPPAAIRSNAPLRELGLDSLAVAQLSERLAQTLGVKPNPLLFFEVVDLAQLQSVLADRHGTDIAVAYARLGAAAALERTHALIDPGHGEARSGLFRRHFTNQEFYMLDHVVEGQFNVPGACYLEMARQAGAWFRPGRRVVELRDTLWAQQLSSPGPGFDAYIQLSERGDAAEYEIYSVAADGSHVVHANGSLWYAADGAPSRPEPETLPIAAIRARCPLSRSRDEVYEQIHAEGLIVGPSFMPMTEIVLSPDEALARLDLPGDIAESWNSYLLHPSLVTGMFQTALINNRMRETDAGEFIPFAIGSVRIFAPVPPSCLVQAVRRPASSSRDVAKFDLSVADLNGRVVLTMESFAIKARSTSATLATAAAPPRSASLDEAEAILRRTIAPVIGLSPQEIDAAAPFKDYGVNSLMIIDLNRRMEEVFGPGLSRTLFFECQNLDELSACMASDYADALAIALGPALKTAPAPDPASRPTPPRAAARQEPVLRAAPPPREPDDQAIAIVGMALRFPGASTPDAFWQVLSEGRHCIVRMPQDRMVAAGLTDAPWGGYIDGIELFDPLFFNITPREAAQIDPQERLFLETAWHALEDAALTRTALQAKRVGVFVGALWQPYMELGLLARASGYKVAPSSLLYSIANRVSYVCGFNGPSLAVDTACSSSLTSLHLACQSLLTGESEVALAGGVNLTLGASKQHFLAQNGFLSSDGRCRSFGAGGDGYVPGEGVAALVLMPLAAARATGRQIHGVIRGSAINHGGRTNGYTVPNPRAQSSLIRAAMGRAGVDPGSITYIEAHGTGTELGDPIEISALAEAFRGSGAHCAIGSAKSNIGHLEAAAGVAGVIKVLLQFRHGLLAPSLHSSPPNPHIDFSHTPFRVQGDLAAWERLTANGVAQPRRAGVSSFGAGGSNAHVVLEESVLADLVPQPWDRVIVPLSARDPERLRAAAVDLRAALRLLQPDDLPRLAYTLQTGREAFEARAAFVVTSIDELAAELDRFLSAPPAADRSDASAHPLLQLLRRDDEVKDLVARWQAAGAFHKLAEAWQLGLEVDWSPVWVDPPRVLSLPGYPFARERHWLIDDSIAPPPTGRQAGKIFRTVLRASDAVFADHVVEGRPILPGSAYLSLAHEAVHHSLTPGEGRCIALLDVRWQRPCVIDGASVTIIVSVSPSADGQTSSFAIHRDGQPEPLQLCVGTARIVERGPLARSSPDALSVPGANRQSGQSCYATFTRHGLAYGPSHQRLLWAERSGEATLVALKPDSTSGDMLPPALVDAAFQASLLGLFAADPGAAPALPAALASITVYASANAAAFAHLRPSTSGAGLDIDLLAADGQVLAVLCGFETRQPARKDRVPLPSHNLLMLPIWQEVAEPAREDAARRARQRLLLIDASPQLRAALAPDFAAADDIEFDAEGSAIKMLPSNLPDHIVWDITRIGPNGNPPWSRVRRALLILKEMLAAGLGGRHLEWTILAQRDGHPTSPADPAAFAIIGLLRTAAREHPRWQLRIVAHDGEQAGQLSAVLDLKPEPQLRLWQLYRGALFQRQLVPLARHNAFDGLPTGLRDGGVYLVIGGAGGIGQAWSEELIRRHKAQIIWIGRRTPSPEIDQSIARLAAIGPAPRYVMADAGDAASLARVRDQVLAWRGAVHGIFHAAMVLDDALIETMTPARLDSVMAAKVAVCEAIRDVFDADPPETVVLFSSINAFAALPGQGNYTAACCYADSFAEHLAVRWPKTRVRSVNWGYWGSVGAVAAPAYRERMARLGFGSIDPSDGFAALDMLMRSAYAQLVFVKSDPEASATAHDAFLASGAAGPVAGDQRIEMGQASVVSALPHAEAAAASRSALRSAVTGVMADVLGVAASDIDDSIPLADYGLDAAGLAALHARAASALGQRIPAAAWSGARSLADVLATFDVGAEPSEEAAAELLTRRLVRALLAEHGLWESLPPSAPDYLRLWHAVTRRQLAGLEVEPLGPVWEAWRQSRAAAAASGARATRAQTYLELMQRTLPALADLLRGRIPATDILFPGGSLQEVERVYRHNDVAMRLNGLLAEAVTARLAAHRAADGGRPFRILEIGAGTGATTGSVLDALSQAGLAPDAYVFSDLSTAFLSAAASRFGSRRGWFETARIDITSDPWLADDVRPLSFDLVIAANVLHATPSIRSTLNHTKAFLRPGGLLLLHELTDADWFNHLTFGLLSGWWMAKDKLRIEGSPLLSVTGWRSVLADAGFTSFTCLNADEGALAQAVLAAVSDGAVARRHAPPLGAREGSAAASPAASATPGTGSTAHLDAVRAVVSRVTRIAEQRLRVNDPFEAYGVDSIVRLALQTELEAAFGTLPATLLFTNPSIAEVSAYLDAHQPTMLEPAPVSPPLPAPATVDMTTPSVTAVHQEEPAAPPEVTDDAIAIIGIAGRFPRANDLDELWQRLIAGENCAIPAPEERWPNAGKRPHGGFIDGVEHFDHALFRLTHAQAAALAPEVRLFLETAWETFQNAGYGPLRLKQAQRTEHVGTGVFVAAMYHQSPLLAADPQHAPDSNVSNWMIANRVSHAFDLTGPSMALDTACSGGLTAIHIACESLRAGSCSMALAGGVNLTLLPGKYDFLKGVGFLSEGEASRSFGQGDGFLPGEGVGAVLLKPLRQALADSDRIEAVIRGSHVTHSGGRQSFYAPDPRAQARLIATALARAGLTPEDIGYVDAAANGSEMADAIEAVALAETLAATPRVEPCVVGAVKSNLGHLEAASGISQLAKVVLQMRYGQFTPTLFATPRNAHLRLDPARLRIQEVRAPWPRPRDAAGREAPRRALINSFGAGGAYACLIVEEYIPNSDADHAVQTSAGAGAPQLFVLSAHDAESLDRRVAQLIQLIEGGSLRGKVHRLAATLQRLDSAMPARLAIIATGQDGLLRALHRARGLPEAGGVVLDGEVPPALEELGVRWLSGAVTSWGVDIGALPPLRLPSYPFDRHARFPLRASAAAAEGDDTPDDLYARILSGAMTEEEFANMVLT